MSKTHLGRSGWLTAARSQGDSGVPRHDARVRTANNLLLLCHFIADASETLKTFSFFIGKAVKVQRNSSSILLMRLEGREEGTQEGGTQEGGAREK